MTSHKSNTISFFGYLAGGLLMASDKIVHGLRTTLIVEYRLDAASLWSDRFSNVTAMEIKVGAMTQAGMATQMETTD